MAIDSARAAARPGVASEATAVDDPAQRARWRTSWILLATALVGHGLTMALLPLFLGWSSELWRFEVWGLVIGAEAFLVTLVAWLWSNRRARSLNVRWVGWIRFLVATLSGLVWVLYMPAEVNGFVAIALPVSVVRIVGLTPPVGPFVLYTGAWSAAFLLLSRPFGIDETVFAFFVAIWMSTTAMFFRNTRRLRRELHLKNHQLETLRAELEILIDERSRQVDDLAVQLQHKVIERSRALAKALDGVTATHLDAGDLIDGRVEVIRFLGSGGMGTVYLGTDRLTNGLVAVKLMYPGVSGVAAIRRFLAEAEVVSRVSDPGIVRTMHIDVSEDGLLYQVMEYVEGVGLDRRLAHGARFDVGAAARIGAAVARALAAAHEHGIVHRDIKPANILLTRGAPGVRILDFGISKLVERSGDARMTGTQGTMGTPAYMSPEQIRHATDVTTATDVYSLGVVLFELFAGRLPFDGKAPGELYAAHLNERPRDLGREAAVPDDLALIVEQCLDKSAEFRPTAHKVHELLTRAADAAGAPAAELINRADSDRLRSDDPVGLAPTAPG